MKKILSILVAAVMVATLNISTFVSVANAVTSSIAAADSYTMTADTFDVRVNQKATVRFEVTKDSLSNKKDRLTVFDDKGNTVTKLYDNGLNDDMVAGDGVYCGSATVMSQEDRIVTYHVGTKRNALASVDISFYNELTKSDYNALDSMWAKAKAHERSLGAISDSEKLSAMYDYFADSENITNVVIESDDSISFCTTAGIPCVYNTWDDTICESNDISLTKDTTVNDNNALTIRPYYTSGQSGFANENYTNMAGLVTEITGGRVTDLKDSACDPYNIVNAVGDYGLVMIDTHGTYYNSQVYFCVSEGSGYDSTDYSAGRVVSLSGGGVGINGAYFTKYMSQNGDSFGTTLFYAGSCYGGTNASMANALIGLGCDSYIGYTESVSFTYEAQSVMSIFPYLTTINPSDNRNFYSVSAALEHTKNDIGAADPYGGNNAALIWYGDGDYTIAGSNANSEIIVTFNPNNGDEQWQVKVMYGDLLERPIDPVAQDSAPFSGWYKNGIQFDFTTPVTRDMTLTACYERVGEIWTIDDLNAVRTDLNGDYELMCDLTLSGSFSPIGTTQNYFTGKFNGNGHTLNGLSMGTSIESNIGLFAVNGGSIRNLTITIENQNQIVGNQNVGAIAGQNLKNGNISHCSVTVSAQLSMIAGTSATSGGYLGAICGNNEGVIEACHVNSTKTASIKSSYCGGITGRNSGTIKRCYTFIDPCTWANGNYVGGVVGINYGIVSECIASGRAGYGQNYETGNYIGGLIGMSSGALTSVECIVLNSCYNGYVQGKALVCGKTYVGGLIGYALNCTIENCYSYTDSVECYEGPYGLGIAMASNITVNQSYTVGTMTASNLTEGVSSWNTLKTRATNWDWTQTWSTQVTPYILRKVDTTYRNDFTVTYRCNVAGSTMPEQETHCFGDSVTVAANADIPNATITGWVTNDGEIWDNASTYSMPAYDLVLTAQYDILPMPTVKVQGMRVFADENADIISRFGYAFGTFTSLAEMKTAGIRYASTSKAFTANRAGDWTVFILTNDNRAFFSTVTVTENEPSYSITGALVTADLSDTRIEKFGYAIGEFTSYSDMKESGTLRLFSASKRFYAPRTAMYTVYIKLASGSEFFFHENIEVHVPNLEITAENRITATTFRDEIVKFGYRAGAYNNFEDFNVAGVRYASTTKTTMVLTEGRTYTIYIRMNDGREIFKTVTIPSAAITTSFEVTTIDGKRYVTAVDNMTEIKRMGYTFGNYETLAQMRTNGIRYCSSTKKFLATNDGVYTIYVIMKDGSSAFYHITVG